MRPDAPRVMMGVAAGIFELVPETRTPFGQAKAGMAGMLVMVMAQEADRLAYRLDLENHVVAEILKEAAPLLPADLRARALEAAAAVPADIRVSTLQSLNDRLRGLLIEVHAVVEESIDPEAPAMNVRIWDELRESTRRRHVELPR